MCPCLWNSLNVAEGHHALDTWGRVTNQRFRQKEKQKPSNSRRGGGRNAQDDLNSWKFGFVFLFYFKNAKKKRAAKKLNGSCHLGAVGIDAQIVSPAAGFPEKKRTWVSEECFCFQVGRQTLVESTLPPFLLLFPRSNSEQGGSRWGRCRKPSTVAANGKPNDT